jgi:hypothetical protein
MANTPKLAAPGATEVAVQTRQQKPPLLPNRHVLELQVQARRPRRQCNCHRGWLRRSRLQLPRPGIPLPQVRLLDHSGRRLRRSTPPPKRIKELTTQASRPGPSVSSVPKSLVRLNGVVGAVLLLTVPADVPHRTSVSGRSSNSVIVKSRINLQAICRIWWPQKMRLMPRPHHPASTHRQRQH